MAAPILCSIISLLLLSCAYATVDEEATCDKLQGAPYPTHEGADVVVLKRGAFDPMFILDGGRVKYNVVANVFKLRTINILTPRHGKVYVGSDKDGYIPLTFTPGTTVEIDGDNIDDIMPIPTQSVTLW